MATLSRSGSDISVEDGVIVWRMSTEVADFYAAELDSLNMNRYGRIRRDAGVAEDVNGLLTAVREIEGENDDA